MGLIQENSTELERRPKYFNAHLLTNKLSTTIEYFYNFLIPTSTIESLNPFPEAFLLESYCLHILAQYFENNQHLIQLAYD